MNAPTVEQIKARTCAHVDRDAADTVALVRVDALPGHKLPAGVDVFNTATCMMCVGRVLGAMYVADCEHPEGDRAGAIRMAHKLANMMHVAQLEPSHDLALALIEVGASMARELGRRAP